MLDLHRMLSVMRAWGISLSHNTRLKLGYVSHRMAMTWFLRVQMALSATFKRLMEGIAS